MKTLFTLGLFVAAPLLSSPLSHAEDEAPPPAAREEPVAEEGGNDLGHGSCAAHLAALREYEECLERAKAGGGTRTGIYRCGTRPVVPARCE